MFGARKRDAPRKLNSGKYPKKLEEVVLAQAKLRFCPEQLQNLNYMFLKKLQQKSATNCDKSVLLAKSVAERLVQRLLCSAGSLDERFSSKFLISNENLNKDKSSKKLEYLVRIDCLSTPILYESDSIPRYSISENDPDFPVGYGRIRLHATSYKIWSDCTNSSGYLRRDKVQARLVELLAQSASNDSPDSPLNVDESVLCAIPGKIVDPLTLYHLLKIPTEEHIFYGPGGNVPRFPDPRDFRLAIVDEPNGIRLRIEFLSPALSNICIEVRLLVAIGVDAWPKTTDFPTRVALGHTDCFLYHQAAQTGFYLVGFGVQSSAWQIRLPTAESLLLNHYGPNSTIRTILDILNDILDDIKSNYKKKHHTSHKILNRYVFLSLLFKNLEDWSDNPSQDLINWSPLYLSSIILKFLDQIIVALNTQKLWNYFFKKSNLLVNPGHLTEEDFLIESKNIKMYLIRLFDESLMPIKDNKEFNKIIASQESETILLYKWKDLIDGLLPPIATRGRRFCFAGSRMEVAHTEYTIRQLEFISILLKLVLKVKESILQNETIMEENVHEEECNHLEDAIYILVTIMDQARDQYLRQQTNLNIVKNKNKIKYQFNCCTSKLVESIRKDKDSYCIDLEDDMVLVKTILKWLYKAIDQNKRCLTPILRPYLNTIFTTSHLISWHLEFIKQRMNRDELNAIGYYSKLINNGQITPAQGLIDAVNKNWIWAKSMLNMVEKNTLRVVFISGRGKVHRHILSLPSYQRQKDDNKGDEAIREDKNKLKTMPNRNYFTTLLTNNRNKGNIYEFAPQHEILKDFSPLTQILDNFNRKGDHKGYGDIFQSLLSMQKLNVFQQVTGNLPQEERCEILELIQSMQLVKTKKTTKRWSNTLPVLKREPLKPSKHETIQKYTPKEESAGICVENKIEQTKKIEENVNSLIRSCRAARIKEDNSVLLLQDSFKIKSLLNKSESFKY